LILIYGDGWFSKRSDNNGYNVGMCFGINEFDVVPFFESLLNAKIGPHKQKPNTCKIINLHRTLPAERLLKRGITVNKESVHWLYKQSTNFKFGFIQAYFTADGSVRRENGVQVYSIRKELLEVVSNVLREFGIYNTISVHNYAKSYFAKDGKKRNNKTTYAINVYAGQFKKIGFLSKFKNDLLLNQIERPIYRYKDYVTITNINPKHSIEDVYDITVFNDKHSYLDGGVVAHNCGEILLRDKSFCNLSEVVVRSNDDLDSLLDKVETAAWIGVIQSTFTNFPYLRKTWQKNCEEERLLGVSLTGQMDAPHLLTPDTLKALKSRAIKVAKKASKEMGINMPAAITAVKPSGSVSQLVDSSSGLHPRFSKYYIRRYRISSMDSLFKLIQDHDAPLNPENGQRKSDYNKAKKKYEETKSVMEAKKISQIFDPKQEWSESLVNTWIVSFPIKAPDNCITTDKISAIDQLEWYKKIQTFWCEHNASITVYVKPHEWFEVGNWVYKNWDIVNGIAFLPYQDHKYEQPPYEEITKEKYEELIKEFPKIDYNLLSEYELHDETIGNQEMACVGGGCEIL